MLGCAAPQSHPNAGNSIDVDAVLKIDDTWTLFRFGGSRYQSLSEDSLPAKFRRAAAWMEIASPGGAFRPVQGVVAGSGHFYLVDAAQKRLCLYDSGARLLSTFPLPPSNPPASPGRVEIFRGANGSFTVVDYLAAEAWQYADRRESVGGADWVLLNRAKLPLGISDCFQEPGNLVLDCRVGREPARFDVSLNRIGAHSATSGRDRMVWHVDTGEWVLEASAKDSANGILFRFRPSRRQLEIPPPR